MKAQKIEEARRKMVWQNAMYDASLQNGFLRISWDAVQTINPVIFEFKKNFGMDLRALRLVGIGLQELPQEVSEYLPMLEVLSLANNELTSLPDNVVKLSHLRELNLMYNQIEVLPSKIGLLCSLERLGITNNLLRELPITLGGMVLLRRLDVEQNKLRVLPENLDNMTSCEAVNANYNQLTRLPRCLSRMPSLTQVSACGNGIEYIPLELASSLTITCLRLSRNRIRAIPERLGDMRQLQELCLDFNPLISKLPLSFWRLSNLKVLRIEGNAELKDPPPTVLGAGAAAVVAYCRSAYFNDKDARMRHIVLTTQNILRQLKRRDMGDPALFNPEVQLDGDGSGDVWCGMQVEYFWGHLLPEIQKLWEVERRLHNNYIARVESGNNVTSFEFTQQEVLWAFANYHDAVGPVLRRQKAKFRRCACAVLDAATGAQKRTPCVPPEVGYMCLRECVLLKVNFVRQSDKHERLWKSYKSSSLSDAMKRAEHEARLFLNSHEGQIWVEEFAYEQAEEFLVESGAVQAVERRHKRTEERKQAIISRYESKRNKLVKVRDVKMKELEKELEGLKNDQHRLQGQEGYVLSAIEQRIQNLTVRLARLPENAMLAELQEQCEQQCRDCDDGLFEDGDDNSTDTSQLDSSDYSSDDESPEAEKFRRRLQRRDEIFKLRNNRLYRQAVTLDNRIINRPFSPELIDDSDAQQQLEQPPQRSSQSQSRQLQRRDSTTQPKVGLKDKVRIQVNKVRSFADHNLYRPFLEPVSFHTAHHYARIQKRVRKRLRVVAEVSRVRVRKLFLQANGHFDELQKELKYEIFVQYVNHHVNLAREKARRDFHVIETVRENIDGAGKQRTFKAWKKWVWTKQRRVRRDTRQRWKMATRGFDAAMESVNSAQYQVNLWEKLTDIYSDKVYWRHRVTHKITFDRPGIEHFLPPNYHIPIPPEDLPHDIPLETSSSDDSDDDVWMERYAAKRRQKAEQQKLLQLALQGELSSTSDSSSTGAGSDSSADENRSIGDKRTKRAKKQPMTLVAEQGAVAESHNRYLQIQKALEAAEGLKNRGVSLEALAATAFRVTEPGLREPVPAHSISDGSSCGGSSNISQAASSNNRRKEEKMNSADDTQTADGRVFSVGIEAAVDDFSSHSQSDWAPLLLEATPSQPQQLLQPTQHTVLGGHQYQSGGAVNGRMMAYRKRMDRLMRRKDGIDSSDDEDEVTSSFHLKGDGNIRETAMYRQRNARAVYVGEQQSQLTAQLQGAVETAKDYMQNNELYQKRNMMMSKALMTKRGIAAGFTGIQLVDQQLLDKDLQRTPQLMHQDSDAVAQIAKEISSRAGNEYEIAAKAIRKKRNQLNPQRHHTYMSQMNRKPRSLQQHLDEHPRLSDTFVDLGDGFQLSEYELQQLIQSNDALPTSDGQPPVGALLRLAGGNKSMIHETGKDGIELRTVLAQRALHVKKKLEAQAVERGLRPPKKNSLYRRELRPLFLSRYKGSSSEEEEENAEIQRAKGKAARRVQRMTAKADKAFMTNKITTSF